MTLSNCVIRLEQEFCLEIQHLIGDLFILNDKKVKTKFKQQKRDKIKTYGLKQ